MAAFILHFLGTEQLYIIVVNQAPDVHTYFPCIFSSLIPVYKKYKRVKQLKYYDNYSQCAFFYYIKLKPGLHYDS